MPQTSSYPFVCLRENQQAETGLPHGHQAHTVAVPVKSDSSFILSLLQPGSRVTAEQDAELLWEKAGTNSKSGLPVTWQLEGWETCQNSAQ